MNQELNYYVIWVDIPKDQNIEDNFHTPRFFKTKEEAFEPLFNHVCKEIPAKRATSLVEYLGFTGKENIFNKSDDEVRLFFDRYLPLVGNESKFKELFDGLPFDKKVNIVDWYFKLMGSTGHIAYYNVGTVI